MGRLGVSSLAWLHDFAISAVVVLDSFFFIGLSLSFKFLEIGLSVLNWIHFLVFKRFWFVCLLSQRLFDTDLILTETLGLNYINDTPLAIVNLQLTCVVVNLYLS